MLKTGITGKKTITVTEDLLAKSMGSGLVAVFATPMMIAYMEGTAAESVSKFLKNGQTTVGTVVNITHLAATPEKMNVTFETELVEISPNGKILTFTVLAYDEVGLIGEGTHQRAIVNMEHFEQKTNQKLNK